MNYYLKITSKPNYPLLFDTNQNNINGSYLSVGRFLKEVDVKQPIVYVDAKNSDIDFEKLLAYDAIETVGGGILYSFRFIDFLKKWNFDKDVQIFQAIFEYKNNICNDYYVVNVYNKIECYDLEKSVYEIHPVDKSYKFTKKVLKPGLLEEYDCVYNIVRDSSDNRIIVSNEFRTQFKKEKINSITFSSK